MYKNIAQLCYLTPVGFALAIFLYTSGKEKRSLDAFRIRQSLALGLVLILVYQVFLQLDSNLFYGEPASILAFAPLLVLWILGFAGASAGKERPLPLIGGLAQRVFAFIK